MGFSLSGRVAGGAQDAVAEQIQTILAQKKFEEQIRAQQAQEQLARQQLALGTRRQDFAESQANDEMQQGAIADMRAQQEKQKLNLTRLNTEQEVNDLINQIGDPNAKIVSGLRARGVNAPNIETPVDPEADTRRELDTYEAKKKIDAKYRPAPTSKQGGPNASLTPGGESDAKREVVRLATALKNHKGFRGAFGTLDARLPTFRQDTADAESLRDSLMSSLTLENVNKLKGVLSDRDMQVLRQASTSLNPRMGEAAAAAELDRLIGLGAPEMASSHGPQVGETRTVNGVPAVWDGKGWVAK